MVAILLKCLGTNVIFYITDLNLILLTIPRRYFGLDSLHWLALVSVSVLLSHSVYLDDS